VFRLFLSLERCQLLFEVVRDQGGVLDAGSSEIDHFDVVVFGEHEVGGLGRHTCTLRSRWTIPFLWRYYRMLTISAK
jgi:hypothetical protein